MGFPGFGTNVCIGRIKATMVYERLSRFLSTTVSHRLGHWKKLGKGDWAAAAPDRKPPFDISCISGLVQVDGTGSVCDDSPALFVIFTLSG